MDARAARDVVDELERVRQQTRGDRRPTSVPLLIFGALTLVYAAVMAAWDPYRSWYWVVAAPAGFALVASYYRRQETEVGVGSESSTYGWWAVGVLLALVLVPVLVVVGAPLGLVGLGLLVIAVRQRNTYLGVWAAFYGVVGVLEGFYVVTNRLYELADLVGLYSDDDGYFSSASALVAAALGLVLVGAGVVALRHEVGAVAPDD